MTAPANTLSNPFVSGDTVTVPAGFGIRMTAPDRGFILEVPKPETAVVLEAKPGRVARYHNGKQTVFLPTLSIRMNEREYEADITPDFLRANNADSEITVIS